MTTATSLGIQDVSELTGLSIDTLRWYEKEGLLPVVGRRSDGRAVDVAAPDLWLLSGLAEVFDVGAMSEAGAASVGRTA